MLARVELTKSVPMNTGTVVLHVVFDSNDKSITPFSSDERSWILSIDQMNLTRARTAIRLGNCGICDHQVVLRVC